jgi:hypothetical protein
MTEMRLRKEVNQTVQTTESYVYGTLIYSGVNERAKECGIGIITYNGECLTPRPL